MSRIKIEDNIYNIIQTFPNGYKLVQPNSINSVCFAGKHLKNCLKNYRKEWVLQQRYKINELYFLLSDCNLFKVSIHYRPNRDINICRYEVKGIGNTLVKEKYDKYLLYFTSNDVKIKEIYNNEINDYVSFDDAVWEEEE